MLPVLVYACNICPKNIEATIYAMLMATTNFGALMGGQLGNLILYQMGITAQDFSRLWMFIAFTSVFLLLPLPWVHLVTEPSKKSLEEPKPARPSLKADDHETQGLLPKRE